MSDFTPLTPPAAPREPEPVLTDLIPEAPPRKRGHKVLAVILVVFLGVAGGGAFALAQLGGGGPQPESRAPGSTFAFAKIDLDPALSQKLAVREFASKFPSAPQSEAEDVFETFVGEAMRTSGANYEKDVAPWFDGRVGIAGFIDDAGNPQVVGILKVSDEDAARAGLEKLAGTAGGEMAFRLDDGFATVGMSQFVVDVAAAMANERSLADNDLYRGDVDALTGDQIVTGWADFDKIAELVPAGDFGGMDRLSASGFLGLAPVTEEKLSGRLVAGLHFTGDYVEIEGIVRGGVVGDVAHGSSSLLTSLPAQTVGAVAINGLEDQVNRLLDELSATGMSTHDAIASFETDTGLRLREDLLPLLGTRAVVSLDVLPADLEDVDSFRGGFVSEVADPDAARVTGDKIEALAADEGIVIETDVRGTEFFLAVGQGYLEELMNGGGLGDSERFRKAMGDLGEDISGSFYVDLQSVLAAADVDEVDLRPLEAVGVSAGRSEAGEYFRMRLVAS